MATERLQKILSNAGVASRRAAEELILAGRVAVNGEPQRALGARADIETDEVTLDGVPVTRGRYRYFALNKPAGIITTAHDEIGRETVLDLVPIGGVQLHPVGRLDRESEGLVILTNDGHLTDLLTHPRYGISKEYLVGVAGTPSRRDLERMVRGVEVDGERLKADSVSIGAAPMLRAGEETPQAAAWLILVLRQGKNREIRRLLGALGMDVRALRRVRIGPLHLGELGTGAFRELSDADVEALYAAGKAAEQQAPVANTPSRPSHGG
ncbi:MAG TPA: pseudouridine synthase [Tepidiformaceae bacterium]|nr:pseudouridine synthase [Tepidiformaceae bacterium]